MSDTVTTTLTRSQVRRLIGDLVAGLGGAPSGAVAPLVKGIKLRAGLVALGLIAESFVAKARGGTGEDGITWTPLTPGTIAQRPVGPGDRPLLKAAGVTGKRERGLLTPAENKRWSQIFASRKAWLRAKFGMSDGAASARAAQIAWATLKGEGAKTKLQVLGGRDVEIGRSSGRLLASLTPGVADPQSLPLGSEAPPPEPAEQGDQVLRDETGAVVVGSNVVYAASFHAKRPLWSDPLPAAWEQEIAEAVAGGIAEAVGELVERSAA